MPSKKKPQRNALYFYVQEVVQPQLQKEGRHLPNGLKDVYAIGSHQYKELTAEEKAKYEKMARDYKRNKPKVSNIEIGTLSISNSGREVVSATTSYGGVVDEDLEKKRQIDRDDFADEIYSTNAPMRQQLVLIHFEYMCETLDGDFLPLEIALIKWSMEEGISKTYHKFINPGPIPMGYRSQCKDRSEERHQIPVEGLPEADSNHRAICNEIESFCLDNRRYLPVYCMENTYNEVQGCIDWLFSHAQQASHITVCILEDATKELYRFQGEDVALSSIIEELVTSKFDYEPNIKCKFHDELEVKYCALLFVRRYAYMLTDMLSAVYDFTPDVQGKLRPKQLVTFTTNDDESEQLGAGDSQSWRPQRFDSSVGETESSYYSAQDQYPTLAESAARSSSYGDCGDLLDLSARPRNLKTLSEAVQEKSFGRGRADVFQPQPRPVFPSHSYPQLRSASQPDSYRAPQQRPLAPVGGFQQQQRPAVSYDSYQPQQPPALRPTLGLDGYQLLQQQPSATSAFYQPQQRPSSPLDSYPPQQRFVAPPGFNQPQQPPPVSYHPQQRPGTSTTNPIWPRLAISMQSAPVWPTSTSPTRTQSAQQSVPPGFRNTQVEGIGRGQSIVNSYPIKNLGRGSQA